MARKDKVNTNIFNILRTLIYIITVAGIAFFLFSRKNEILYLIHLNYLTLIILFIVGLIPVTLNALLFRNNISFFGLNLSFIEWYGLAVTNTMYNYILPARGGLALRAIYLKRSHQFPFAKYISLTLGSYLFKLFLSAVIASVLSILLLYGKSLNQLVYLYISIMVLIGVALAIIFLNSVNLNRFTPKNSITNFLKNAAEGIEQFKGKPHLIRKLFLIHLFFIIAISLRLFIAFHAINTPVSFLKLILVSSLIDFTMIFSLTPGNMGIKEGIIGLSSGLLNISGEQALMGAVIDRIVAVIVVFALGILFNKKLLKENPTN